MRKFILTMLIALTAGFALNAQTISSIVADSPDHNTLEAALAATELTATLDGTDEYTLFAPTDDAFTSLPEGLA